MNTNTHTRRARKSIEKSLKGHLNQDARWLLSLCHQSLKKGQKFILPFNGRMLDDRQLRGIEPGERIELPYPVMVFEYKREGLVEQGEVPFKEALAIAVDGSQIDSHSDHIFVIPICRFGSLWGPIGVVMLNKNDPFIRSDRGQVEFQVRPYIVGGLPSAPMQDMMDEVGALFDFMNASRCSNVRVSRVDGSKIAVESGKPLDFDEYYVLTIHSSQANATGAKGAGCHRSPREHLRRGHIRRLSSGVRVWVNSTVVGAQNGAGKIFKTYRVQP